MGRDCFWSPKPVSWFFILLSAGLTFATAARAEDTEPFQVEVNIFSATIKAGETPIASVPRETKLLAHAFNENYYLVDLPGSNPPRQGWIAKDDVHRVVDDQAELMRRVAAAPPEQKGQILADANDLVALVKNYKTLDQQGNWRESAAVARQLAERTVRMFGDNSNMTAGMLEEVGIRLDQVGDYATARKYHLQALAIRRVLLGETHAWTADSLNNLGCIAQETGDLAAAQKYHQQALAVRRAVFGEQSVLVAQSLENLALVEAGLGNYSTAHKDAEQAVAIKLAVVGRDDPAMASALQNLGEIDSDMGDHVVARGLIEQALNINRRVYGDNHPTTAESFRRLGEVAFEWGDYVSARQYLEQALAIDRQTLGPESPSAARSLYFLGVVAQGNGDFATARKDLEQSLAITRKVFGEKAPAAAEALNSLGDLALCQNDTDSARRYFSEALAIRREVSGSQSVGAAQVLANLGVVNRELGDYDAARQEQRDALKIVRAAFGDQHPETARGEMMLAWTEAAAKEWQAAADAAQETRRIARRHVARVLPALAAREQLGYLKNTDTWSLHECLTLGLAQKADSRMAAASAAWLLNGKAVTLEVLSSQTRFAREATSPIAAQLLQQLQSVRSRLATMSLAVPPAEQRAAWQSQLNDLENHEEYYSSQLGAMGADVKQPDPWIALADVRRNLPAGAMLIDIARFDPVNLSARLGEKYSQPDHYVAWLIPPAGQGDIRIIDLGEAEAIDVAVKAARQSLRPGTAAVALKGLQLDNDSAHAADRWRAALAALAARIWRPLEPHLATARQVIISPDAALWLVPWAALPTGDGRQFALEKWQIRYVTSARDIALAGSTPAMPGRGAAIFADPDFDLGPKEALAGAAALMHRSDKSDSASSTAVSTAVPAVVSVAADNALAGVPKPLRSAGPLGLVPRLPGTADEAEAIRPALATYAGTAPRVYLREQALESVLKQVKRPKALVLSTHGFFLPKQEVKLDVRQTLNDGRRSAAIDAQGIPVENPLLRCGLLLAGCNHRDELAAAGADDGVLTGLEIVGCDLRGTELVVLSACETAIGDVHDGEGVAGLRQAFQLAGAKAVVATLWQIPDRETATLMTDFFANLAAGQSKADALRGAQLKFIKTNREKLGSAPPFYWAAFTLTGQ